MEWRPINFSLAYHCQFRRGAKEAETKERTTTDAAAVPMKGHHIKEGGSITRENTALNVREVGSNVETVQFFSPNDIGAMLRNCSDAKTASSGKKGRLASEPNEPIS